MKHRLLIAATIVAAMMLTAGSASAQIYQPGQQRSKRPDWAIFGSGVSNTSQKLILMATFGGGYDDDLTPAPAVPPLVPATPFKSGPFGSAGANLSYTVDKDKVQGGVQFGAYGRNYREMKDPFVGTYSASGNLGFTLSKKATLGTSYFAGQYLQNLAPGYDQGGGWGAPGAPQTPMDPGTFTGGNTYRAMGASANYNHNLTTKLAVTATYSYYVNDSWSRANRITIGRYDTQYVNAGLRYALAKGLGLRVGYGATLAGFGSSNSQPQYHGRTIDAGVDYGRALSVSRNSTLSFSTGATGVQDLAGATHYYFVGNVNYDYQIGRTWSVWSGYNRSTNFYQTLGQPTLNDSINAGFGGLIGRRVDVSSGVSLWRGSYVGSGTKSYVSANAYAQMQVALNRVLAITTVYSFYHYEFAPGAFVPPGFIRQIDRQSIRVSLTVWAPLMTQARRTNASR
jgi:hypothetical protein